MQVGAGAKQRGKGQKHPDPAERHVQTPSRKAADHEKQADGTNTVSSGNGGNSERSNKRDGEQTRCPLLGCDDET